MSLYTDYLLEQELHPTVGHTVRSSEDLQLVDPKELPLRIERPAWIAFIQFLQMLFPDSALILEPFCEIGTTPPRPLSYTDEAYEIVRSLTEVIFPTGVEIQVFSIQTGLTDRQGLPMPEVVLQSYMPFDGINLSVYHTFHSPCLPTEKSVLQTKMSWGSSPPDEVLTSGRRLYIGVQRRMRLMSQGVLTGTRPPIYSPTMQRHQRNTPSRKPVSRWVRFFAS
jgi:hypothetical protein